MTSYFLRATFCLIVAVLLLGYGVADAELIIEHVGQTVPPGEGWTQYGGAGQPGNDGEDHWSIEGAPSNTSAYYSVPAAFSDANGWTATARVKGVSGLDVASQASLEVFDGSDQWILHLLDGSGGLAAGLYIADSTGLVQLAALDPAAAYHTYQVEYDPSGSLAKYYLDGAVVGSRTRAEVADDSSYWAAWGDIASSQSPSATESHWALVRLETGMTAIPEPSSMVLVLVLGVLGCLVRRRR